MDVRFCTHCGQQVADGAQFCTACGAPVEEEPRKTAPAPVNTIAAEKKAETKATQKKRGIPTAAVVALLLVIVGASGFLLWQHGGKDALYRALGRPLDDVSVESGDLEREEDPPTAAGEPAQPWTDIGPSAAGTSEPSAGQAEAPQTETNAPTVQSGTADDTAFYPAASNSLIQSITATSVLTEPQYSVTHSANRILDGDLATAWSEGASDNGVGESVTIVFSEPCTVSGLNIWAGYHKSGDAYRNNSRPAKLCIIFSDGTSETFSLSDEMCMQQLELLGGRMTSSITIRIDDVYRGAKFEDTLISELVVY